MKRNTQLLRDRISKGILFLLYFVEVSGAVAEQPQATDSPLLTHIVQIRKLTTAESRSGLRARVRGVVTYYDNDWRLFVQDETGGTYVLPSSDATSLQQYAIKPGDGVEVEGTIAPGGFSPIITIPKFTVLERDEWPKAHRVSIGDMATGSEDAQWIEIEGIVRASRQDDQIKDRSILEVAEGRNRVMVYLNTGKTNTLNLVDAKIRVRGVCGSRFNARHQLIGGVLNVPGLDQLEILKAVPYDPSTMPVRPISDLLLYSPEGASGHRVRVQGVVTLQVSPSILYIKDQTAGICLKLEHSISVKPGDRLDAVGFPWAGDYTPVLEDAGARKIESVPSPEPVTVTALKLQEGEHDANLVRLRARISDRQRKGLEQSLILQADGLVFNAILVTPNAKDQFEGLPNDALVELTGICQVHQNERDERSFEILVGSPADIRMLQKPSWWNSTRLAWTLGVISVVLLLAMSWGLILANTNAKLKRAKAEFSDLYDNAPIGYHEIDVDGRITRVNQKELAMLGYRAEEMIGHPVWAFIAEPDAESNVLLALADPQPGAFEWSFRRKDGSLLAVWLENQNIRDEGGRILGARTTIQDISELKQVQAELKRAHHDLELRVAARTKDLANVNLYLKGEIAERKRVQSEMESMQSHLIEWSRKAGMAEVATGVLHNVGNVLNSVNVSSTCVANNLKKSRSGNLFRLVALLREHEADLGTFIATNPKGKQLPDYLAKLADHLRVEQTDALKELSHLQKNIDHIRDIISMQQNFAKVSGVPEPVKPIDLVEDALRMNASTLVRHDIEIVKIFRDVPLLTVEKHKVLQILVNLIRNAKQACDHSGRSNKKVIVQVANGEGRIRISVTDNGVGIPQENLTRIFGHGFTTKKDGHGFGLHSGALAARELGGELRAHSEGAEKGATFTLDLPIVLPKAPFG